MEWLNYHHLLYFWTVARTGSVAAASKELRLAAPTISNQIRKLEDSLGEKLLRRSGRGLMLTEMGRTAMTYADEIFALGREFAETMKGGATTKPLRLRVGIVGILPKIVAYRLLQPAFTLRTPLRIVCREAQPDHLLADLVVHELDLVLLDSPVSSGSEIRAFSHLLRECGVSFFASKAVRLEPRRFPKCVDGARFLAPTINTAFRRKLDEWFAAHKIHPAMVGEFEDAALLRAFAENGFGIFAAPSMIDDQLRQSGFKRIGKADEMRLRFYAITVKRKVQHPAVVAICEAAQRTA